MGSIVLKDVSKSFGETRVIQPINLEINEGEFVVFVGPSGCGKSTLLRMIAGLEDVTEGQIEIDGNDATHAPPARRELAMVFQSYALYPHMSVRNNIAFPLKQIKTAPDVIEQKVNEAAGKLNLLDYLDRKPGQLSGGQRQRVAIGRAIVRQPKAFLFDEPLSNLDAALRGNMRLEISQLHKNLGSTMIYVTHDQIEAMTMADRIVVFNKGIIEQVGTPLELYQRPTNQFVAAFIGSPQINFIAMSPTSTDATACLGIRPEHLEISSEPGLWRGEVNFVEHLGAETIVHVKTRNTYSGNIETLKVKASGDVDIRIGNIVNLQAAADKILHFDSAGKRIERAVTTNQTSTIQTA